jgi:DNA-binding NtrC family response regulator
LIADVERDIALSYKKALEKRNHHITTTENGEDLLKIYQKEFDKVTSITDPKEHIQPFDAVLLDHKMPKINGINAAEKILIVNPHQRVILAADKDELSLHLIEGLTELVELLQKPFGEDSLIDTIEEKEIYSELQKLDVNIEIIKTANFRHEQLQHLADILRSQRPRICDELTQ